MANIKLTGHTWDTSGIYDAEQEKTQAEVNQDVAEIDGITESVTQWNYGANIFDGLFPQSGSISGSSGQETDSTSFVRTDYIPIDNTQEKIYFLRQNQPYLINARFYSGLSTDTFVSGVTVFAANTVALTSNIDIPSTAKYVRLVKGVGGTGYIDVTYTYTSQEIPYIAPWPSLKDGTVHMQTLDHELQEKINSEGLPFYGKTIVFMGDSIVGNFNDETGICSVIAAKTGATVINCGFGGTRMGYRYSQYGDATPGASGYVSGATDAQKNQVDQYRYWNALSGVGLATAIASGVWTLQDSAVANMDSGLNYFSDRLAIIKTKDWSEIDYILWEYGTNDFSTEVKLSDTSDTSNYFAFDNAYREAIEQISTAYPNIQIIPITPLWRWWDDNGTFLYDSNTHSTDDYSGTARLLTAFVSKVQEIAREYQLPCIDDYYTMGANKFTYLHYYNNTDGVHPNSEGRERIAEHIASQLDTVV